MKKIPLIIVFFITLSCSKTEEYLPIKEVSPVVMNLEQVPYNSLSQYKFFSGILKDLEPSYGVLPYELATGLFTDYAEKKRFVWLPEGTKASYDGDGKILNFPVGTALIKTFFYRNVQPSNNTRIIESRIMIKKATGWIVADYVWNDNQTDAFLQTIGGTTQVSWRNDNNEIKNVNYRIPSENECQICHKISGQNVPLGIKPQNININNIYPEGVKNQLTKFIDFGYLENSLPSTIVSIVDYKDLSKSLNLRVRSYFEVNCSACHQVGGYAQTFDLRFAFSETSNPSKMGVCLIPQHIVPGVSGNIVKPSDLNRSILYYRVNTTDPSYRMPFLGRTIKHDEGVQLIQDWINSVTDCPN